MALDSIRGLTKKTDVILMGLCVLLAAGFLLLAGTNVVRAGNFLTIDSLFFSVVCLLLALTFIAIPALTMHERGLLHNPFAIGEGIAPARASEDVHFEGSTKLFLYVLVALLVLTLVEVLLAYFEVPLTLMLTILIGLSLTGGAHHGLLHALRFERMSPADARAHPRRLHLLLFISSPTALGRGTCARTRRRTRPRRPRRGDA